MSAKYTSANPKNDGRPRPVMELTRRQSMEVYLLIAAQEHDFEVIAPNEAREKFSDKFSDEGWLLDEDLFFKGKYRFYINTYGWAQSSVEMDSYKKRGYLPDSLELYREKPFESKIYLIGLVDTCKTYGQRFSAALMRTAVLGRELSILTTFVSLQTNNQTYCANRDPRNPLRPCSAECNCKKTVVYDVHELNFIALQKVSTEYLSFICCPSIYEVGKLLVNEAILPLPVRCTSTNSKFVSRFDPERTFNEQSFLPTS